jgi:lysophospholipase L1-like esterase
MNKRYAGALFAAGLFLTLPLLNTACSKQYSAQNTKEGSSTLLMEAIHYVAMGDSTGAGVGSKTHEGYVARIFERIERERPGSILTNLCVSGATTYDLIRSQLQRGIDSQPTLVTVGIGINDVNHGITEEEFARSFEQIISRVKSETSAAIVVTNIPDISYAPAMPAFYREEVEQRIAAFNARIDDIAKRYDLALVDSFSPTRELLPSHPEFFSSDGFHPSDEGYEYWAKIMWPTVKQAIGG